MFKENLCFGRKGESLILAWLRKRGFTVLPVYEKIFDTGKGPQLYTPSKKLVAPDALVYRGKDTLWIEAKRKTGFSLYRITGAWNTGIDKRHYKDYLTVEDESPWPVWLLFLHEGGQAKDSPPSPSGLFCAPLSKLRHCVDHDSNKWGPSGMVYWDIKNLTQIGLYHDGRIHARGNNSTGGLV